MNNKFDNNLNPYKSIFFKLVPYIFYFIIFSFIGWVIETIYCSTAAGMFIKRGFLNSPICPIYGSGALILTLYLDKIKKQPNYIKIFFLFIIVFSFFEYLVGFTLDALFAARWWDYASKAFNINGRITMLNSFFWGIMTILFTKFIYPLINKTKKFIEEKISKQNQFLITSILISWILIDFVISCINYLN